MKKFEMSLQFPSCMNFEIEHLLKEAHPNIEYVIKGPDRIKIDNVSMLK